MNSLWLQWSQSLIGCWKHHKYFLDNTGEPEPHVRRSQYPNWIRPVSNQSWTSTSEHCLSVYVWAKPWLSYITIAQMVPQLHTRPVFLSYCTYPNFPPSPLPTVTACWICRAHSVFWLCSSSIRLPRGMRPDDNWVCVTHKVGVHIKILFHCCIVNSPELVPFSAHLQERHDVTIFSVHPPCVLFVRFN